MKTTLECTERLRENVAIRIVERDEGGSMVGFWLGYWYRERGVVRLYPGRNPNCTWSVPRVKHTVDDRLIRYKPIVKPVAKPAVNETIPPPVKRRVTPFAGPDAKPVLLEGQERLEF